MTNATPVPLASRPAMPAPSRPDWLEKPTSEDLAAYYPRQAQRKNLSGKVMMSCTVKADGQLEACEILEETPPGERFGEAALKMAPKFRMTPPGDTSTPSEVTIPLIFEVPPPVQPTPRDYEMIKVVGLGIAGVSALLLVGLIVLLGRYHSRAARGGSAKP